MAISDATRRGLEAASGSGLSVRPTIGLVGTTDPSGGVVEAGRAGSVSAEADVALLTTVALLTLTVPARKIRVTVQPDTAGGDAGTSFMFCVNPPTLAIAQTWLDTTIPGPRMSVLSNQSVEFTFSSSVTSLGVAGTTALGDAKIEVTA